MNTLYQGAGRAAFFQPYAEDDPRRLQQLVQSVRDMGVLICDNVRILKPAIRNLAIKSVVEFEGITYVSPRGAWVLVHGNGVALYSIKNNRLPNYFSQIFWLHRAIIAAEIIQAPALLCRYAREFDRALALPPAEVYP